MAPTEGRVTKPEWWWGCRRGTLIDIKRAMCCHNVDTAITAVSTRGLSIRVTGCQKLQMTA